MGRSEDLFKRISDLGETAIDGLIADSQSEELFLDFKRSADNGSGKRLHNNDRQNLAKAISGFGNSEGGVIIWGVDCSPQVNAGDVATAKVPIQNPKRFLSWLEGAVSGCTVPPHPLVRHAAIESGTTGTGFVVTHIPKSYLAPHQCLKPLQYYIRSGSDFVPTPHAVLSGLFGRRPQPFVFHMWSFGPAKIAHLFGPKTVAEFDMGFMLSSYGPGIARNLYVNVKMIPPKDSITVTFSIDNVNWIGQQAFGLLTNLVSKDSFRLAPLAIAQPIKFHFRFTPPFDCEFIYEIVFGHGESPIKKMDARVKPVVLQTAYDTFLEDRSNAGESEKLVRAAGDKFIRTVLDIKESDEKGPVYIES